MRTSSTRKSAAIVALAFFSAFPCAGQPTPLIRSNSRLVLLDVVVTDKAGNPIRGLNKEDFTVLENGIPQKIASFEAVSTTHAEGLSRVSDSRTIILLDQLNTSFSDLAYARDSILQFLDQDSARNQPIALMSINLRGLAVAQDFTQDRKQLKNQLTHLTAVNANSKGNMDLNWAPEYAQAALGDLTQIARASVGSSRSLNVIWVTSGFAGLMPSRNVSSGMEAGLRSIANLLIRSRMRLYTIDPAGVVPKIPMGGIAAPQESSHPSALEGHQSSADKLASASGTEAAEANVVLSHMTRMMGGISYYGRNDVARALGQSVLDGSSAYVISYSPSNTDFNGEYRKIQVHTSVDGSTARTREGYYAVANEAAADRSVTEARLEAAMSSPLLYAGVDLSCPATFDPAKDRLTGKLVVAPKTILATSDTREQIVRISSFSKDRRPLNVWSWRVNWKDPWTSRVVSESFDKVLSPKAVMVRFLVSDSFAERIGTCNYNLR